MRTSMLFRKQLLGVDCTLPHDLSLFSIMIYSTTSPAEAIESNVLAYFKHDLKSYILNNKFVAFIFESSMPIRIDCFEFVGAIVSGMVAIEKKPCVCAQGRLRPST